MPELKTVLIVDDDQDISSSIRLRFNAAGYKTIVADTAESGMIAARAERPQAIVMDVRMSGRSGLDAIEELKDDDETKDIPIIMLSGCVNSQQEALDKGARFFLRKPYRGRDVLTAVEAAIQENPIQPPNRYSKT